MIKLYFKQAFFQLRENRLISLVSIIGTALAICMIMVIVLVLEVRITDCVPEVNRSRSLYMKAMSIHQKGDTSDNSSNGCMSLTVAKECFKALTVPETVTIVSTGGRMRISVPAGKTMTVDNLETDDTFWKVFSFDFIAGKPFTAADSESGLPKVVISASVARNLFGTVEAVGRTVQLNLADYTVVGVVKDVSKLAVSSYAQIWIPFNSTEIAGSVGMTMRWELFVWSFWHIRRKIFLLSEKRWNVCVRNLMTDCRILKSFIVDNPMIVSLLSFVTGEESYRRRKLICTTCW